VCAICPDSLGWSAIEELIDQRCSGVLVRLALGGLGFLQCTGLLLKLGFAASQELSDFVGSPGQIQTSDQPVNRRLSYGFGSFHTGSTTAKITP
jgi:hypothetical protein